MTREETAFAVKVMWVPVAVLCLCVAEFACSPKAPALDHRGDNSADYLTIQTPCGPKRIPRSATQEEVDRILGSCPVYGR